MRLRLLLLGGLVILLGIDLFVLHSRREAEKWQRIAEYARLAELPGGWIYERESIPKPDRKVRQVHRTPKMQEAVDLILAVLREAQKQSNGHNCELHFYGADGNLAPAEFPGPLSKPVCDSLQLFCINDDHTVSPLGKRHSLPAGVYCFPDNYYYDEKKRLYWSEGLRFNSKYPSLGEIVLLEPGVQPAPTFNDRVIYYMANQIFQDGGDDLIEKYWWCRPMVGQGDTSRRPSFPVRPE